MPRQGERRTVGDETREWNGRGWVRVATPGAASRAAGAFVEETPFNPKNLAAMANPKNWYKGLKENTSEADLAKLRLQELLTGKDPVTGLPSMGRAGAGAEALYHAVGAVPFIGQGVQRVSERIAEGEIPEAAGATLGIASGGYVPGAARGAGRAARATPAALQRHGGTVAKGAAQAAAIAIQHGPARLATAAIPYAVELGGRGLSRLGKVLEGLQRTSAPAPAAPAAPGTSSWTRWAAPTAPAVPRMRRSSLSGPFDTARLYQEALDSGMSEQAARRVAGMGQSRSAAPAEPVPAAAPAEPVPAAAPAEPVPAPENPPLDPRGDYLRAEAPGILERSQEMGRRSQQSLEGLVRSGKLTPEQFQEYTGRRPSSLPPEPSRVSGPEPEVVSPYPEPSAEGITPDLYERLQSRLSEIPSRRPTSPEGPALKRAMGPLDEAAFANAVDSFSGLERAEGFPSIPKKWKSGSKYAHTRKK